MTSKDANVSALVAFSTRLAKSLSLNRLPPTYVGVPRRRPSSKEVQSAWRKTSNDATPAPEQERVSFLVKDDNGNERRMTKREKKEAKRIMLETKKERQRKRKAECLDINSGMDEQDGDQQEEFNSKTTKVILQPLHGHKLPGKADPDNQYHELQINNAAIQEELADLRGDRDGVPPVALMPCLALQASRMGISMPTLDMVAYELDEPLAEKWAASLKESLEEAEKVRMHEDLRSMAYQLVPEVWKRLMPNMEQVTDEQPSLDSYEATDWSWIPMRPRMDPLDSDKNIVCSLLHSRTNLHISCGSKFGCDFLLYDGPRQERHAFAGLRVIPDGETPRAYDLHGYVRCLNTAGKLSLLARVIREGNCAKVAFVDLALEKILTAPRHTKRTVKKERRDVTKNLAKKPIEASAIDKLGNSDPSADHV